VLHPALLFQNPDNFAEFSLGLVVIVKAH